MACKIWSLSRVEGDIDIDPAKQNNYNVHRSHINTCVFNTYRRYRISNKYVLLADMRTSNRNNRLKSESDDFRSGLPTFGLQENE